MPCHRNTHLRVSVSLCAALCLVPIVDSRPLPAHQVSQTAPATDEAAKANEAYQAKDWVKAALLYQQVVLHQPKNGRAWYRLAASSHALDKQDEAIAAYQKSMEAGSPPGTAEYGIAVAYAAKHDTENTFQYLQRAVQDGFSEPDRLSNDEELSSLCADARFAKISEQATHNLKPCAYNSLNRQFDFWIGEWDVVTAEGANPAGTSKIELILGDCVIQENWIMHFWTEEIPQKDDTKLKRHLQFIPSGKDKVRQFSQGSTDGGKTWKVEYDFIYTRKK
jgi:tetratricopeptide (TPR) repeat protein